MNYKIILYILTLSLYIYLIKNLNNIVIQCYKNPISKLLFMIGLYMYGFNNIILSILLATCYIDLGQQIKEKELLFNIV